MKLTLLQYVQSILSSLDSDEVNSIGDNPESLQVAEIVRAVYFNIIARTSLPEHHQLIQLDPSINSTMPVLMYVPEGINKIEWLKYFNSNALQNPPTTTPHGVNTDIIPTPVWSTSSTSSNTIGLGSRTFTVSSGLPVIAGQGVTAGSGTNIMNGQVVSYSGTTLTMNSTSIVGSGTYSSWVIDSNSAFNVAPPGYQDVTLIPVLDFLNIVNNFNPADSNVFSMTLLDNSNKFPGDFTIYYKNDRQPMYATVLSDYYVLFDSYDSTQDSTLQGSKTMAYGQVVPTWQSIDSFVPNIDEMQVPLLLSEAKSLAFYELKQTLHQKAEQENKRQWSSVQKDKSIVDKPSYFDQLPDFGRNSRSSYAGLSYFKMRGWDRP